jgi:hypothetical protein
MANESPNSKSLDATIMQASGVAGDVGVLHSAAVCGTR